MKEVQWTETARRTLEEIDRRNQRLEVGEAELVGEDDAMKISTQHRNQW